MSDNRNCILDFEGSVEMTEDEIMKNQKWYLICFYYGILFVVIAGLVIGISNLSEDHTKEAKESTYKKSVVTATPKTSTSSYKKKSTTELSDCISIGCEYKSTAGSVYCSLHAVKPREEKEVKKVKSASSTTKKTKRKLLNPYDSYDDGYEDVYEDDDYDWDRYRSDDDYADGVDDAMEDMDW